jgi:hypothetical protein
LQNLLLHLTLASLHLLTNCPTGVAVVTDQRREILT